MLLYNENNGEIGETLIVNSTLMSSPYPKWGLFEYQKVEYNPDTQTLGEIKVVDNIASEKIINFPDWSFPKMHIRITVREKIVKPNGKLSGLGSAMTIGQPDEDPPIWIDDCKYKRVYLSYMNTADGFTLINGVISSVHESDDPKKFFKIEQLNHNFEIRVKDEDEVIIQTD